MLTPSGGHMAVRLCVVMLELHTREKPIWQVGGLALELVSVKKTNCICKFLLGKYHFCKGRWDLKTPGSTAYCHVQVDLSHWSDCLQLEFSAGSCTQFQPHWAVWSLQDRWQCCWGSSGPSYTLGWTRADTALGGPTVSTENISRLANLSLQQNWGSLSSIYGSWKKLWISSWF